MTGFTPTKTAEQQNASSSSAPSKGENNELTEQEHYDKETQDTFFDSDIEVEEIEFGI